MSAMMGFGSMLQKVFVSTEKKEWEPIDISDCVGWWDFTDATTMWVDSRPNDGFPNFDPVLRTSDDNVSSDGDAIEAIDNKAYYKQNNNANALGSYLHGSTSTSSSLHREYKTGGANGHSYARLGNNAVFIAGSSGRGGVGDYTGLGSDVYDPDYFKDWPLSESTISLDNFTIFLVADARNGDGRAFSIFGDKEDSNDSSRKEFHLYHDRTTPFASQYKIDCYDGSTTTTISSGTSGKSDNLHIITGVLSGSGDSQLYRDGDNTDGTTTANSGSGSIDITHSSPNVYQKENRIVIGRNINISANGHSTSGSSASPGWSWGDGSNDRLYEIICYNRELTAEEISTVETNLKTKYDIS